MTKKYTLTLSKRDLIFIDNALCTAKGLYEQYHALSKNEMHGYWQDRIKRADKLRGYIEKVKKEQNN